MLKILFFLLLLINGGLYAFQYGYLDDWMPSSREPARIKQQLNADKLQLLPAANLAPATAAVAQAKGEQGNDKPALKPVSAQAAAALDKTVAAVEQAMTANGQADAATNVATNAANKPSADTVDIAACTEIGNFDAAEAKRFETKWAALSPKQKIARRAIPDSLRHIVYMPPQENRAGAEKKAAELKNLGIDDFFIIQDDSPLQWGISLGVFKTAEAARKHLADLNKKGVRSARISDRGSSTGKVAFQLSAPDAPALTALRKIKADFPRQQIRDCNSGE
jgi:hypothetical protein